MSKLKIQEESYSRNFQPSAFQFPTWVCNNIEQYLLYIFLENQEKIVNITISKDDLISLGYETKKQRWSESEDRKLLQLTKNREVQWQDIANHFERRNAKMCYNRFRRLSYSRQRSWKKKDDEKILELIQLYGECWNKINEHFPHKNQKQIKDHYKTHLRPGISKEKWSLDEDIELVRLLSIHGSNWTQLAKEMTYRPYGEIKNRYYGRIAKIIQKKLLKFVPYI